MKKYIKSDESKSANWYIDTFSSGSKDYRNLSTVATLLNFATNSDDYYVNTTYYDYGQDWKWTTIIKDDSMFGGVQVLTPALQEKILNASTIDSIAKAAQSVLNY